MSEYQTKAILVSLNMRAWKATATDRELAEATESATKAETGTMRVIKDLTPKSYIQPIKHIMHIGRTEHYRYTVPGLARGQHLLASAMFDTYMEVQSELRRAFEERVENFVKIYPDIVQDAPRRLHNAFKAYDFPPQEAISQFFEYSYNFTPVPKVDDWRLSGLNIEETEQLKELAEANITAMFNRATKEVFDRAKEVLTKIAQQARAYNGGSGSSAQLRDATIQNLKEVAQLVVKMNVTGDHALAKLGYEMIEAFADAQGDHLRSNEKARLKIAKAAERLAKGIPSA
jgi:hypothetical protein